MRAVYTPSQSSFGTFGRADDKDELTGRVNYNVRVVSTVLDGCTSAYSTFSRNDQVADKYAYRSQGGIGAYVNVPNMAARTKVIRSSSGSGTQVSNDLNWLKVFYLTNCNTFSAQK